MIKAKKSIVLFTVLGKTLKGLLTKTISNKKLVIESGEKKYHVPANHIIQYGY